jgi:hypothetical protein
MLLLFFYSCHIGIYYHHLTVMASCNVGWLVRWNCCRFFITGFLPAGLAIGILIALLFRFCKVCNECNESFSLRIGF